MTRLTKKIFNNNNYAVNNIPSESDGVYYCDINVLNKLGKLEDLEEQLGCPLEVIFKAFEEGVLLSNNKLYKCRLFYPTKEKKWTLICYKEKWTLICHEEGESIVGVKLSDYQKTWWLKGEKTND